jgi:hypothetical protein
MSPSSDKSGSAGSAQEPGRRQTTVGRVLSESTSQRRADLEAQKRYMDDRFGRDRTPSRRPSV